MAPQVIDEVVSSGVARVSRKTGAKPDRLFYTGAGALFLVLTLIGFQHYIFEGKRFDGTSIEPSMVATVVAHSSAIFAWYVLFFVQSLLIYAQNRRLHMKLGWSVLVIAATIAVTGPMVATGSMRISWDVVFFDWSARQFLLIMYSEIALFVVFVAIGVLNRKRPRIHRPMMLMASLSLLSGAASRITLVNSVFGLHRWMGLFGPPVVVGALLLLVRVAMTRKVDREFVVGYAAFVVATFVVSGLALTSVWGNLAGKIIGH